MCAKSHPSARFDNAREPHQILVLNKSALPVAAFRPGIRIKQVDARKHLVRQPVDKFAGVAEIKTDIDQCIVVSSDQCLANRIDKSIGTYESDLWLSLCLCHAQLCNADSS